MSTREQFIKEIKVKAASFCAYRERTQQEVRDKLYEYGLHRDEVEELISELITENFINEERFARSFAGGKFRLKRWGRMKILMELKRRRLTDYCIQRAMEEITDEEYSETLGFLVSKKSEEINNEDPFIKKNKIARYLIGKGYESDIVWEILNKEIKIRE